MNTKICPNYLTAEERAEFKHGDNHVMHKKFGAHCYVHNGQQGVYFCVWAPYAKQVAVIGDFNGWDSKKHLLGKIDADSVVWEGFIPEVGQGDLYKYSILTEDNQQQEKIDPFGFAFEKSPQMAAIVYKSKFRWSDAKWCENRKKNNCAEQPISIYELHAGSWQKKDNSAYDSFLSYRELADELIPYLKKMGFTHLELMPIIEHPFYPSWGYLGLGFFAPTSRYGSPDDLKYFINQCHANDIGVVLDWVPSHFPADGHGLVTFDGKELFEKKEVHPDWDSCIFNLGSNEVVSFLISNAVFWCEEFHCDGIRVDAVASMLYLDYSRSPDQWEPNIYGGKENLEAVAFLRRLNVELKERFGNEVLLIAEESSAWPKVSERAKDGGLNFDMKWNMGWMHDVLHYFKLADEQRVNEYEKLTFSFGYMFHEKFLLSLSHDEVVHTKSSLLGKMYGQSDEEKFANLRCLYGFMFAHPGKKLLFMGSEIASWNEWDHDKALDWDLLKFTVHAGIQQWVCDLNKTYCQESALYNYDFSEEGFAWIAFEPHDGVLAFLRYSKNKAETILIIGNFHNKPQESYYVGSPHAGIWEAIISSDEVQYGGRNSKYKGTCYKTEPVGWQKQANRIDVSLAPLSVNLFKLKV